MSKKLLHLDTARVWLPDLDLRRFAVGNQGILQAGHALARIGMVDAGAERCLSVSEATNKAGPLQRVILTQDQT